MGGNIVRLLNVEEDSESPLLLGDGELEDTVNRNLFHQHLVVFGVSFPALGLLNPYFENLEVQEFFVLFDLTESESPPHEQFFQLLVDFNHSNGSIL